MIGNKLIYINEQAFKLSEEYGHYVIRDYGNNSIICTCESGELNETLSELEQELTLVS